ncbi:MAG: 4Fe-4S binding protein [Syntrophomonadaceae bacterium]|nr:4Fe-4S binding protein [Syntrophomonadaceae bacterium]
MAIKTARFNTAVTVEVDYNACIHCGRCAEVCKGQPLFMADGKLKIDQERIFGCIGCGHCMCVCPQECIQVRGRDINPQDVLPMPEKADLPGYEQLYALLLSRRSVRSFQNRRVEPEKIALIIEAVSTAPMGLPPSDVEVLILDGFDKVQQFADDIIAVIRKSRWFFSPLMTALLKPFFGKEYSESVDTFIRPAVDLFVQEKAKGQDVLLYHAPLAMYFHASPYADPADSIVAATYAMLAAQSLGLGSCMIGTPPFFIKYSREFKQKYRLPPKNQPGIVVIFGYPQIEFSKALQRRLGKVTYR